MPKISFLMRMKWTPCMKKKKTGKSKIVPVCKWSSKNLGWKKGVSNKWVIKSIEKYGCTQQVRSPLQLTRQMMTWGVHWHSEKINHLYTKELVSSGSWNCSSWSGVRVCSGSSLCKTAVAWWSTSNFGSVLPVHRISVPLAIFAQCSFLLFGSPLFGDPTSIVISPETLLR